jgi:hypothetical protein
VTVRAVPGFAAISTRSEVPPRPVFGVTAAHDASVLAVQLHADWALSSTATDDACAPTVRVEPLRTMTHGAAACVTVAVMPIITTLPCRALGSGFAATVYPTWASPCPLVGPASAIHDTCVDAVHVQSRSTPSVSVPDPPCAPKDCGEAVSDAAQRLAADGETEVDAVVPHAASRAVRIQHPKMLKRACISCPECTSPARDGPGNRVSVLKT